MDDLKSLGWSMGAFTGGCIQLLIRGCVVQESKKYLTETSVHQALLLADLTEPAAPDHAIRLLLKDCLLYTSDAADE